MPELEPLMRRNFVEYASYVVLDRAIPDVRDGLKPVQRRILWTLREMDDGRFHKVANVIGETMKLHPHGDAAIRDALVVLANKGFFIERQGNFGNVLTGHPAAAPRYIECRLTPLARETLFSEPLIEWRDSYDGRKREPVVLPAKIPVLLMIGAEGIAVGMATRILPHNPRELLEAQIALLEGKEPRLLPDFPQGGIMDASEYDDGRGRVRIRARIERRNDKVLVVREIPYGTTTESLIASVEAAAQKGQVKIQSIRDFTTDRVEIEIRLPRGVHADEALPQLFAYTDCEVSLSSSIITIREGRPDRMTVTEVLAYLTDRLLKLTEAELRHEKGRLEQRLHRMTLERIFIEHKVYAGIERAKTSEALRRCVWDGMHEFEKEFVRPMVEEDVDHLLRIPIRRISAFDIERHRSDVEEVRVRIAEVEEKLSDLRGTVAAWIRGVLERHGADWERRTSVESFETVDRKAVARPTVRVAYDPETGFFGSKVKGERFALDVSPYDRILVVFRNGVYKVIAPPDKVLFDVSPLFVGLHDAQKGVRFTVVYRDRDRIAWGKKVRIKSFVTDREYSLIPGGPDPRARIEILAASDDPGAARLEFLPAKRQRVSEKTVDLAALKEKGVKARGLRLSPKPVARVKHLKRGARPSS